MSFGKCAHYAMEKPRGEGKFLCHFWKTHLPLSLCWVMHWQQDITPQILGLHPWITICNALQPEHCPTHETRFEIHLYFLVVKER
jgi:hypothetical protein